MDVLEDSGSIVFDDREPDLFQKKVISVVEDTFDTEYKNNDDGQRIEVESILFDKNFIEQILNHIGLSTGTECHAHHGYHRNYEFRSVGFKGLIHPCQDLFVGHHKNLIEPEPSVFR